MATSIIGVSCGETSGKSPAWETKRFQEGGRFSKKKNVGSPGITGLVI